MPSGKPSAFEKRVKRRIIARPHDFFAACPPGLKQVCRRELAGLDAGDIRLETGGVSFSGKLETGYLANLWLRSPSRILMRIHRFKAERFSVFEEKLAAVDWELYLPAPAAVSVQAASHKCRLYHSEALADRCRTVLERALGVPAPDSTAHQTLMVRGDRDRFTLSLDMSGPPLFKRGIKRQVIGAPIRENLAFAILDAAGLNTADTVLDPMCGSGTFSLEAAMARARIPAGFFRSFAFEAWPAFKPAAFAYLKKKAAAGMVPCPVPVLASDIDPDAVSAARANVAQHDLLSGIRIDRADFFDLNTRNLAPGLLVLNPPYGIRLRRGRDTSAFYREIGKKLAADFNGWRVAVIFPEKHTGKLHHLRLRPFPFFHGGLDLVAGLGII